MDTPPLVVKVLGWPSGRWFAILLKTTVVEHESEETKRCEFFTVLFLCV